MSPRHRELAQWIVASRFYVSMEARARLRPIPMVLRSVSDASVVVVTAVNVASIEQLATLTWK